QSTTALASKADRDYLIQRPLEMSALTQQILMCGLYRHRACRPMSKQDGVATLHRQFDKAECSCYEPTKRRIDFRLEDRTFFRLTREWGLNANGVDRACGNFHFVSDCSSAACTTRCQACGTDRAAHRMGQQGRPRQQLTKGSTRKIWVRRI